MTRLIVPKVCRDCGERILTLEELDRHDLHCTGPVTLVHLENGDIIGEVKG